MGDRSDIQWTDATWNPVTGCTKVSPDVLCHEDRLDQPLRWRKPRRVFVNSMSDLFHDDVPDEFIDQAFAVMALASRHTFQVLTKRPERMRAYLSDTANQINIEAHQDRLCQQVAGVGTFLGEWPLPNVWLGVSVENQSTADDRIPVLLRTPAAVRFISVEPLLEAIRLTDYLPDEQIGGVEFETWPDWVIVGGESGPEARICSLEWIRDIRDQCQCAGVPVFVKQLGSKPGVPSDTPSTHPDVKALEFGLRDRKGGNPDEWPEDLWVREFPV